MCSPQLPPVLFVFFCGFASLTAHKHRRYESSHQGSLYSCSSWSLRSALSATELRFPTGFRFCCGKVLQEFLLEFLIRALNVTSHGALFSECSITLPSKVLIKIGFFWSSLSGASPTSSKYFGFSLQSFQRFSISFTVSIFWS